MNPFTLFMYEHELHVGVFTLTKSLVWAPLVLADFLQLMSILNALLARLNFLLPSHPFIMKYFNQFQDD